MAKLERDDIYLISKHSNLSEAGINDLLRVHIYNGAIAWKKFLRIFFVTLASGFFAAGVIMFFAYNWNALGKFSKIGIIELLLVTSVALILFSKLKQDVKNILLTLASLLVGVLFAVFGQVYQTGANAYDFFLGWTLSIAIWVVVANFSALWLLFLILVNTTVVLYSEQVAGNWSTSFVYTLLFVINLSSMVAFIYLSEWKQVIKMPSWFIRTLIITTVLCATIGITNGIFSNSGPAFIVLFLLVLASYAAGILYALKQKRAFYLSVIPFSIVVIIADLMLNTGGDAGMFLLTFLFIVASVTFIIRNLISLQKKWSVE